MNKKNRAKIVLAFVIILIVIAGSALYFKYKPQNDSVDKDYCSRDSDCVPSSCCHPSSCTLKSNEPKCDNTVCTMNCQPGTLDCGQGSCICSRNRCFANIAS
jgi:hypothetical protein